MNINKNEVLRYLGYKNQVIDRELDNVIDSCIEEIKTIAKSCITYNIFNIEVLDKEIKLLNSDVVFRGQDIVNHLKDSTKCVVLAVSLGVSVDNRIRYLSKVDVTRSIILDSCATTAVESICNEIERKIMELARNEGMQINHRYSPGYGDFSLNIQPKILKLLNAEKNIGLTCTENYILLPRKSVTAIIGFVNEKKNITGNRCEKCNANKRCLYRRDGSNCGL